MNKILSKFMKNQLRFVANSSQKLISRPRWLCTVNSKSDRPMGPKNNYSLTSYLQQKIKFSGPITVHEYMKEVSTNPLAGYYLKEDAISDEGDFITSPEISQMFGELLAIWIYTEWLKMGAPKPFQLVEFGPGTGSLMQDILRTFKNFKLGEEDFTIHMIEKSIQMCNLQNKRLCGKMASDTTIKVPDKLLSTYHSAKTDQGQEINWHYHLSEVPNGFSMFVANEFFDALPIHKLKKTDQGWREILIDNDDAQFRYVLSREQTPASKLFVNPKEKRDEIEVNPEAALTILDISKRIKEFGGAALIADYGHDGTHTDTFRAFKDHKQVSPLVLPGSCDLTADVDFNHLRTNTNDNVLCYGPINQNIFLRNMGIEMRLENLLRNCDSSSCESLLNGYKMLCDPHQMGERFKVMALLPLIMKEFYIQTPVSGFYRDLE